MSVITFTGNLGGDPVDRTNGGQTQRVTLRVAEQVGNREKGTEKTIWHDVTAFGSLAANAVASLKSGDRVIVVGRLDPYEQKVVVDGAERNINRVSVIANQIGPDLNWASAAITKNERNGSPAYVPPAPQAQAPQGQPVPQGYAQAPQGQPVPQGYAQAPQGQPVQQPVPQGYVQAPQGQPVPQGYAPAPGGSDEF